MSEKILKKRNKNKTERIKRLKSIQKKNLKKKKKKALPKNSFKESKNYVQISGKK